MSNFIQNLTQLEEEKQQKTLNLIASENYPSSKVLELLGSHWSNKYGEGYPGKRYYAGNEFTDKLESFAQEKALKVFGPKDNSFEIGEEYGVNVQTLSGSPANRTVFLTALKNGDKILSPKLSDGGHLTHMHEVSIMKKFFEPINYSVKEVAPNDYEIDVDDIKEKILTHQPALLILGFSSYTKQYKFAELCEFAHQNQVMVLADVAHINGIIAAGLHDSPFKKGIYGADFVSMTTHKTFRGPRSAMLFSKKYLPDWVTKNLEALPKNSKNKEVSGLDEAINRCIFPGGFGGPHFNKIAAMAQACLEILGEDQHPDGISFLDYSKKTLENTKALENSLKENGLEIISPTQNHLCLVKLPEDKDSLEIQKKLEKIGIICNRNVIPFDPKTAWKPSGLRLGMPALTSRGADLEISKKIGQIISDSIFDKKSEEVLIAEVKTIVDGLGWW